jgi:polyhydroxyalkanoate synthase subunit PhaC
MTARRSVRCWCCDELATGGRPAPSGRGREARAQGLYQGNKLVNDAWQLGGRKVDLRQVTMPAFYIYAPADHMIPPRTSRALDGKLGPSGYTELGLPGGDIDMFVSSESQRIVDWLGERDS